MASGLAYGVENIPLLAVPRQAWEDQHRGTSRGLWVGGAGLIVHPVQRNLAPVGCTDEFAVAQRHKDCLIVLLKKNANAEEAAWQTCDK